MTVEQLQYFSDMAMALGVVLTFGLGYLAGYSS